MIFSKSHWQRLNKQLQNVKIKMKNKKILFNKKAMQWLRMLPNSKLKFIFYIDERVKKAQTAEI